MIASLNVKSPIPSENVNIISRAKKTFIKKKKNNGKHTTKP